MKFYKVDHMSSLLSYFSSLCSPPPLSLSLSLLHPPTHARIHARTRTNRHIWFLKFLNSLDFFLCLLQILEIYIYTSTLKWQDTTQGQFLSGVQLIWLQFSFSKFGYLIKAKEPSLSYCLPIQGISAKETQTIPFRIWTQGTDSISHNYKHTKCKVHWHFWSFWVLCSTTER